MKVRVTLSTDETTVNGDVIAADSLVIDEPGDIINGVLKLERHEEFHSIVESFDTDVVFFGKNSEIDGGTEFIRSKESLLGPDAAIKILIEIAPDDVNYETAFEGLLDLAGKEELWDNTISVPIVRNDLWTKLINRMEVPVNLQDPLNLDHQSADLYDAINANLKPQTLKAQHRSTQDIPQQIFIEADEEDYPYIQFDWWAVELSEITEKFNLPSAFNQERPAGLFILEYAGEYTFDIKLCLTIMFSDPDTQEPGFFDINGSWQFDVYIQFNDEEPIKFTQVNKSGTPVSPVTTLEWSEFTHSGTYNRNRGDTVRIYATVTQILFGNPNAELVLLGNKSGDLSWELLTPEQADHPFSEFEQIDSHIYVLGKTIKEATNAEGFLVHDVAGSIIDRITGTSEKFYSEFLGSLLTKYRQYANAGCAWFYALFKGLQIRQYSLIEKPFFLSFKEFWDGLNSILNLSLGYDIIDASQEDEPTLDDYDNAVNLESGIDWALDAHEWAVTIDDFNSSKLLAFEIFDGVQGATYHISLHITITEQLSATRVYLYDASLSSNVSRLMLTTSGEHDATIDLTPDFIPKYLAFRTAAVSFDEVTWKVHKPLAMTVTLPDSNPIEVLRIEEKAHWYDDSETSVDLSFVQNITKVYDREHQFNQVEIGYQKWNAEDVSGIDDPQTKHTYSSIFQRIGQKITLFSRFIAAGLTIEVTRRTTREKSADYKYDNDTFIIALNPNTIDIDPETSPDLTDFQPEFDENFTSVSNLQNSDSRYNLRLTPARNLIRWLNYLSGCLQFYSSSVFKFVSGEGNYDMESTMMGISNGCDDPSDYAGEELSEKQDIPISSDYLFIPEPLQITGLPLSWDEYKTIRDNPKKAIGISQTDEDHVKCFIKSLEYNLFSGTCDLTVWPKVTFDLAVIDTRPEIECFVSDEDTPDVSECFIELETGGAMITETNEFMELETCEN